jgi:two-component system sensor histidine kinase UhpB
MRRALLVAGAGLLLLLLLAIARARTDTLREMEGSLDLARASQVLASFARQPPEAGVAALRAVGSLRHLELTLRDEHGRTVLRLADPEAETAPVRPWRALAVGGLARHAEPVRQPVRLNDGREWTAELSASPDSEVAEAATNLLGLFLAMAVLVAAILVAMHWVVRRSLTPLQALVDGIGGVERHELAAVQSLPRLRIRELEAIASALRHLAAAQERSEASRRVLAHRVMSLQEDERQKLARDLHDEFGQRLTALRVDASWLLRAAALQGPALRVLEGMAQQITVIQDDVRRLLARLRPLGLTPDGIDPQAQTTARLHALLHDLVQAWSSTPREQLPSVELCFPGDLDDRPLPPDLALGLYRITQEALTNVMRHAQARSCRVSIALGDDTLRWEVVDDGQGISDLAAAQRRGSGLAGLEDRIWTLGGRFDCGRGEQGQGTRLAAEFPLDRGAAA